MPSTALDAERSAGGGLAITPGCNTERRAANRPSLLYQSRRRHSIGLQLDHQLAVGVVTDLSGTMRTRIEKNVDRPTPVEAMPLLAAISSELIATSRLDHADVPARTQRRQARARLPRHGPLDVGGLSPGVTWIRVPPR
ncbi:hypothetical protein [Mesorhizobium argentiipisi]|uniref:Uncharacterized protein n=1 Tax=Mesorhizobium argentiipisi TaxID=3015175 RepID=A0ABU8K5A6_9HYPH